MQNITHNGFCKKKANVVGYQCCKTRNIPAQFTKKVFYLCKGPLTPKLRIDLHTEKVTHLRKMILDKECTQ